MESHIGGKSWLGLSGRTIALTGASGGIGQAIAVAAAEAGASLVLLDRDLAGCDQLVSKLQGKDVRCVAIDCDISSPDSVAAATEKARRALGPANILINNAGVLKAGAISSLCLEDWNAVLSVDLTGYMLCAQAFGRDMLRAKSGSIVHVASIAAHHPQANSGAYSVSKAGVVILSQQLAVEWGPHGIRSNSISPGLIRTPLSKEFYDAPGVAERRAAMVASQRIGTPEDIADVALFLASDRAAYVNGADITVDGGLECMLMNLIPRPGFENNMSSDLASQSVYQGENTL